MEEEKARITNGSAQKLIIEKGGPKKGNRKAKQVVDVFFVFFFHEGGGTKGGGLGGPFRGSKGLIRGRVTKRGGGLRGRSERHACPD